MCVVTLRVLCLLEKIRFIKVYEATTEFFFFFLLLSVALKLLSQYLPTKLVLVFFLFYVVLCLIPFHLYNEGKATIAT